MNKKGAKTLRIILIIALIVAIIVLVASLLTDMNKPEEIAYNDLPNNILSGKIAKLEYVGSNNIRILYSDSKINSKKFP